MATFQLLDSKEEEEELHHSRLWVVEERPFKRVARRLLTPGTILSPISKLPTPPPEGTSPTDTTSPEAGAQKQTEDYRQCRDDILMDFAIFEGCLIRLQNLRNSNEAEREKYRADKRRILEIALAVRENTHQLRAQLDDAKERLEQRKKFDDLTDKITRNQLLRPRADQEINLRKLEEECKELQRESATYAETWKERREQFGRIVEEGMQLRRLIRDEKEEVERREGMDGGEEDGEVGEENRDGMTPKPSFLSGNATPRPDGIEGGGLKPRQIHEGASSRPSSRSNSRAPSPVPSERRSGDEDAEMLENSRKVADSDMVVDTPMAESAELPEEQTPRVTIDEPTVENGSEVRTMVETEVDEIMDTT